MNFDKFMFVLVLFSTVGFFNFFLTPWIKEIMTESPSVKHTVNFLVAMLSTAIILASALAYPFLDGANNTLHSPTKYVGAEIVARGTDGAYIFEEMEYGTRETYRYISTNWLPYDAVYLLTVDKETDEVLVVWKTADDGPRIEAVG